MCSLINKQLLLTAYAYLFIMEQQKVVQQGSEALQVGLKKANLQQQQKKAKPTAKQGKAKSLSHHKPSGESAKPTAKQGKAKSLPHHKPSGESELSKWLARWRKLVQASENAIPYDDGDKSLTNLAKIQIVKDAIKLEKVIVNSSQKEKVRAAFAKCAPEARQQFIEKAKARATFEALTKKFDTDNGTEDPRRKPLGSSRTQKAELQLAEEFMAELKKLGAEAERIGARDLAWEIADAKKKPAAEMAKAEFEKLLAALAELKDKKEWEGEEKQWRTRWNDEKSDKKKLLQSLEVARLKIAWKNLGNNWKCAPGNCGEVFGQDVTAARVQAEELRHAITKVELPNRKQIASAIQAVLDLKKQVEEDLTKENCDKTHLRDLLSALEQQGGGLAEAQAILEAAEHNAKLRAETQVQKQKNKELEDETQVQKQKNKELEDENEKLKAELVAQKQGLEARNKARNVDSESSNYSTGSINAQTVRVAEQPFNANEFRAGIPLEGETATLPTTLAKKQGTVISPRVDEGKTGSVLRPTQAK